MQTTSTSTEIKKKKILFSAPLHISQCVSNVITEGETVWVWKKDLWWRIERGANRAFKWLVGLVAEKCMLGQVSDTKIVREGYFWIGADGNLERVEKPSFDPEKEELTTLVAVEAMTVTPFDITKNDIGHIEVNLGHIQEEK